MNTWTVAQAKAKFSEVIGKAYSDGPQTITKNGHTTAIIISVKEWKQKMSKRGNLAEFFAASPLPGSNLKITRVKGSLRRVDL